MASLSLKMYLLNLWELWLFKYHVKKISKSLHYAEILRIISNIPDTEKA
jgi:hypothetical protein